MKQRHIQMIGLAGTLGTGLFLGSGKTIRQGGPLGALLAYIQMGSIAYCMCKYSPRMLKERMTDSGSFLVMSLGEMAVYA